MTPVSAASPTAHELWRNWLPAVDRLVPVPEGFRAQDVPDGEAARLLGVDEEFLAILVSAGFPAQETPAGNRYDVHDVMNLGLLSGTGRSLAELGERQCMRLAAGGPERWTAARTVRLRLTATCPDADCPAPAHPVAPAPEDYGGRIDEWTEDSANPGSAVAVVTTRGRRDEPRTDAVRRVHDELLAKLVSGDYRYGWVPEALRAQPELAVAHGTLDCVIAAWRMRSWAQESGLESRTRRGFLIGLVCVEHAWTEVFEEGRWVVLDPVLAYLGMRQSVTHPEFAPFTRGSIHNRLLGWDRPIDASLADHRCPSGRRALVECHELAGQRGPAAPGGSGPPARNQSPNSSAAAPAVLTAARRS